MRDKIIALIICLLALLPNGDFRIPILTNTGLWFYAIIIFSWLALVFCNLRVSPAVKFILIFMFFNAVLSKAPYISLTCYMVLIAVAYIYACCLHMKSFEFVISGVQLVFLLTFMILMLQFLGYDKLLNFARDEATFLGTIGNKMMTGSFLLSLSPFLIIANIWYLIPVLCLALFLKSYGTVLILGLTISIYIFIKFKKIRIMAVALVIAAFIICAPRVKAHLTGGGRITCWKKTVELMLKRPLFGYGIGTYKVLFPVLGADYRYGKTMEWEYYGTKGNLHCWRQAHNAFLQIGFEAGLVVLSVIIMYLAFLLYHLFITKRIDLVTGIIVTILNMSIFFPTRMIQSVLLIVLFLAICEKEVKNGVAS